MNVSQFITKWRQVELTEQSASQQHFLDLCELLDHPKPAEADPTGESFTFEKGAAKHGGGDGWADVWKRNFFGWEYKGKHKDLDAAYDQLLKYREALENPPLLVVCDMDRIVIHTNFTATASRVHEITLDEIGAARNLEILRAVFHDPDKLRPGATSEAITTAAASHVADIAQTLRSRGLDPHEVAHFLDRIIFCMFAEDIALLPKGIFSRVVENARHDALRFTRQLGALFDAMANGGDFGADPIRHFNGNLFTAGPGLELTLDEIESIRRASLLDWSAVDPSIFGTLFERGMDPAKRSQLGAHYTSREDIETLVEPVVMQPLRREWDELRATVESLLTTGKKSQPGNVWGSGCMGETTNDADTRAHPHVQTPIPSKPPSKAAMQKARREADVMLQRFLTRLANVTVLDPACGSGNFLYVTLQKLKDLEKEVIIHAMEQGFSGYLPLVGPWQLYGIEINPYAHDLAQMTVWIGYLQWTRANGFGVTDDPILRPSNNIQCMDAIINIPPEACSVAPRGRQPHDDDTHADAPVDAHKGLRYSASGGVCEPEWPTVDFIVGNPPFLGDKKMRAELGDEYVEALRKLYSGRIPGQSDLCCYWFERARQHIADGKCKRAGLLATQGIRGGANREVLKRIKETGDIFFAESDRPWILDGANVHVSMVAFDSRVETDRILDGQHVPQINVNLSAAADIASARQLGQNAQTAFMGVTPSGPFGISDAEAMQILEEPNPHGRPNSDVIRPWVNAADLTKRSSGNWILDLNQCETASDAAQYAEPFGLVERRVSVAREAYRTGGKHIWRYERSRPDMRAAIQPLSRFIITPRVSKHRVFVWLECPTLPDSATFVFARSDDYFFGVLHSRLHEVWALKLGTRLETRPRYTPTTCFETFPFPRNYLGSVAPCGRQSPANPETCGDTDAHKGLHYDGGDAPNWATSIADAARELDALRNAWLNPPEWTKEEILEFPGSVDGPWARYVTGKSETEYSAIANPQSEIGMVRYPRLVPRDADCAAKLAKRTLTNLYNQRPTWLDLAHRKLDEAVFAAYGWDAGMSDEEILERLLELNLDRSRERG